MTFLDYALRHWVVSLAVAVVVGGRVAFLAIVWLVRRAERVRRAPYYSVCCMRCRALLYGDGRHRVYSGDCGCVLAR